MYQVQYPTTIEFVQYQVPLYYTTVALLYTTTEKFFLSSTYGRYAVAKYVIEVRTVPGIRSTILGP